ncbi:MAG: ATP-grasp domain-containing protein [Candidatus Thorarchaeota archaeon]
MDSISAPLKGKKVGVVGFNARPIAYSAKKAGASVFASDYWGDEDLSTCSNSWIAVLTPTPGIRQRQPLDIPLPVALVDNLLHLTKNNQLDLVIIGSGFDDYSEALLPLEEMNLLVGCSLSQIRISRDYSSLKKLAKKLEINIPNRLVYSELDKLLSKSAPIDFPCVVRPTHSGGGSGVRFARNRNDIIRLFQGIETIDFEPRVVQEYISGFDVSCSVLSTGDISLAISVQGQLIGMPTAGRNCGFAYCGNYIPSLLSEEIENIIMTTSEQICNILNLKGSVGLDFVVDNSERVWLMEVNPRIQGSLELIEHAGDISITDSHVRAVNGVLPNNRPKLNPGVKMIIYSRRDGKIPDLSKYPNTVDRTPQGVMVNRGDPICTVIEIGPSLKDCYRKVSKVARLIQEDIRFTEDRHLHNKA